MILVGIDDTDMPGTPGTNQLARKLVRGLAGDFECDRIVRHQLLDDPRIPCTTKNGSASISLRSTAKSSLADLIRRIRQEIEAWYVLGSDPGFCVAWMDSIPEPVVRFGYECKRRIVDQASARELGQRNGLHLESLGGDGGGVIGALGAIGLAAAADDGRVVQLHHWPDDLSGVQDAARIRSRGIRILHEETGLTIESGQIEVGKHLRPNIRKGEIVLFVVPFPGASDTWIAEKRT